VDDSGFAPRLKRRLRSLLRPHETPMSALFVIAAASVVVAAFAPFVFSVFQHAA
jgi:hypothetical protein